MKEESQSLLKTLLALNEQLLSEADKKNQKDAKKEIEKSKKDSPEVHDPVDIFHVNMTKAEQDLDKVFSSPVQKLIFRVVLLLGVSADQISIRKFKVRKSVKEVGNMIQHHPQIKNILNKLGKELANKKQDIHTVTEDKALDASDDRVAGTIRDQLTTEVTKKIYSLIIALGIPEFLLTYKKTALKNRIKNLAKIAIKHTRIKTYIYMLCDMLKVEHKNALKESFEEALTPVVVEETAKATRPGSLLEDFGQTKNYAELGTFSVVSMGEVGGTTIKVKDFSVEFNEEQFEKFVKVLGDGKQGVVQSENLGKIILIPQSHGKEYVIKKVKTSEHDKYPFGVLLSQKSIDAILS